MFRQKDLNVTQEELWILVGFLMGKKPLMTNRKEKSAGCWYVDCITGSIIKTIPLSTMKSLLFKGLVREDFSKHRYELTSDGFKIAHDKIKSVNGKVYDGTQIDLTTEKNQPKHSATMIDNLFIG